VNDVEVGLTERLERGKTIDLETRRFPEQITVARKASLLGANHTLPALSNIDQKHKNIYDAYMTKKISPRKLKVSKIISDLTQKLCKF